MDIGIRFILLLKKVKMVLIFTPFTFMLIPYFKKNNGYYLSISFHWLFIKFTYEELI